MSTPVQKLANISLLMIIGMIAVFAIVHIREAVTIDPAKQAVLDMRASLDVSPVANTTAASTDDPPNIIIILADDMGWRDIGYNKSEIRTPVMDRLAREGITLNRFYVQPTCSPTRAALLTGRAPMRHGILSPISKNNPTGLPLDEVTLADRLKEAGYKTALTGKWHLGPRNLAYHPNARGFDHFYGHLMGGIGYYDKVHGGGYDWQRNGKTVREEGYTTHLIAKEASHLIEERDPAKPLFLYVAFGSPHIPNEAPESAISAYSNIKNTNRRIHAAMVSEMDAAIGQIYQTLVDENIEEETLIWFMSDNGGLLANNPARHLPEPFFTKAVDARFGIQSTPRFRELVRANLRDGGSDNRPLRGAKQSVWEGGVRVPAFLHWPGTLDATDYNFMVTVQDVMPTLLEVAHIPPSDIAFDGRNLWAALITNKPAITKEYIIQTSRISDTEAIYRYPYKLIKDGNGKLKLFNIEADPFEKTDIAHEKPALVSDLSTYLKNFPRGDNIAVPFQEVADDPDFFGGKEDRAPWAEQAYWAE